jgi:hypothetical protein
MDFNMKYGFIYIWYDKLMKMYYVGCHWGTEDDGYICSSPWMKRAYKHRPNSFKRRILKTNIAKRSNMYVEEQRYLNMIKHTEIKPFNQKPRYYNLNLNSGNPWHKWDEHIKTVGQKISAAKRGKNTGPRDPVVGQKISEAKKKKFAERGGMSEAHKEALRGIKKKPHTDKWKEANSKMMKERHARTNVEITCPHCGVVGKSAGMKRWHFNNCQSA